MLQLVEPVEPSTTAKKAVIGKARSALRRALNKIRWPVMAQNNSGIRWPCYTTIIWYPSVWKNYVSISIHLKTYTFTASRGNFSSQVFIYKYNFGYGNLKCSGHKPLNLSTGFHSPDLAVLTLFRCCLQHLSLAFARCASGFVDSLFEYIWMMYLNLFEYIWTHGKTSKDIKRHQKTSKDIKPITGRRSDPLGMCNFNAYSFPMVFWEWIGQEFFLFLFQRFYWKIHHWKEERLARHVQL